MGTGRMTKHEIKKDEFAGFWLRAVSYLKQHPEKLNLALGIAVFSLIVIVVAYLLINSYVRNGHSTYANAMKFYQRGKLYSEKLSTSDIIQARELFKTVTSRYSLISEAPTALYYYAASSYLSGDLKLAEEKYLRFIKKNRGHMLHPEAVYDLGILYEDKKDYAKALAQYEKLEKDSPDFYGMAFVKLAIARCYETTGSVQKAVDKYRAIAKEYEEPYFKNIAESRIRWIEEGTLSSPPEKTEKTG